MRRGWVWLGLGLALVAVAAAALFVVPCREFTPRSVRWEFLSDGAVQVTRVDGDRRERYAAANDDLRAAMDVLRLWDEDWPVVLRREFLDGRVDTEVLRLYPRSAPPVLPDEPSPGLVAVSLANYRSGSHAFPQFWLVLADAPAVSRPAWWPRLGAYVLVVPSLSGLTLLAALCAVGLGLRSLARMVLRLRSLAPGPERDRLVHRLRLAGIFAGLPLLYFANLQQRGAVDCVPARYVAMSLATEGNLDLDEFPHLQEGNQLGGSVMHAGEHWVSKYAPGSAILAAPVFALPAWLGLSPTSASVDRLAKLTAVIAVTCSAWFLWQTLLLWLPAGRAYGLTWIYAAASCAWSVSSQDLWQHGPSQFWIALALWQLAESPLFSGLAMGMAVLTRPTDVLIAAALGLYVLEGSWKEGSWKRPAAYALGALPAAAFWLLYHYLYFGSAFETGYGGLNGEWNTPLTEGLYGLLLSPSRGLFVFSPVFLASALGGVLAFRKGGAPLLRAAGLAVAATVIFYARISFWSGGWCFGYRYLVDLTPLLVLLLVPALPLLDRYRALRALFVAALVWSVFVQFLGAFVYDFGWLRHAETRPDAFWNWTDSEIAWDVLRLLGLR